MVKDFPVMKQDLHDMTNDNKRNIVFMKEVSTNLEAPATRVGVRIRVNQHKLRGSCWNPSQLS